MEACETTVADSLVCGHQRWGWGLGGKACSWQPARLRGKSKEEVSSFGAAAADGTLCVLHRVESQGGRFKSFLYMLLITTNPSIQGEI